MKKTLWIIVIVSTFYLCSASYMLGTLWSFRQNMEEFVTMQVDFNVSTSRVISKLAGIGQFNYEFNKSNKEFIQKVAEIYVPDEIALKRQIPARQ